MTQKTNHSMNSPLFIGGLGFLKNHRRGGGSRFSCKNGVSPYGGWAGGVKHCFSLIIVWMICSSNALYLASLSFKMFIFILSPFDT